MPRSNRRAPAGIASHVINRGNDKRVVFRNASDYKEFLRLMTVGKKTQPVNVYGVCLMRNHFHALIEPLEEGALSRYMQWVTGTYATDWRGITNTRGHGHVFKDRFWNDVVRDERHFLAVLRYIEANPWRAGIKRRAEQWPWSSIALRANGHPLLDALPITLPSDWLQLVNATPPYAEIDEIRHPMERGRPTR